MLTDLLPDPFLWISHHQWGDLLGGILGALLSALIAVWVLRRTLKTQRRQFLAQLNSQSESLEAQLRAQADALERQLAAQADGIEEQAERQAALASKERELAARAELIVAVRALLGSTDFDGRFNACSGISTGLERWRFELQSEGDRPLWLELDRWGSVLFALIPREYRRHGQIIPATPDQTMTLNAAASLLMDMAVEFRRNFDGKNWTAVESARVLRKFREESLTAPIETTHA